MGVLTYKPRYIGFLLGDICDGGDPVKKSAERIQCNNVAIAVDEKNGAAEWEKHGENMHTVGEVFGFLIIPRDIRRRSTSTKVINE